jgi:putative FmdB family regulatory protein
MPTYNYVCNECYFELEAFQKMSDSKLEFCPNCSKKTLERVIKSEGSFILRGSGWFKDGYSNSSIKNNK